MDAQALHDRLAARFAEKVTAFQADALQPWAVVAADAIAEVAAFCKSEPDLAFDNLMCLSAVDYPAVRTSSRAWRSSTTSTRTGTITCSC